MKITEKGQVTIPQDIRERMGLLPETVVEFVIRDGEVILRKTDQRRRRGEAIVEAMRGKGSIRMSTDEIMALTRGEQ